MAATGKWEVVGKTKKKNPTDNKKNKTKLKENGLPKAEFINPLGEGKTVFNVLEQKDKKLEVFKPEPLSKTDPSKSDDENGGKFNKYVDTPLRHRVDAKKKASKPPPKTERELLKIATDQLDVDDMKDLMANVEQAFPENPSFWLKDLASYLQLKLSLAAEKDPVFDKEPEKDYPLCLVKKPVQDYLVKILKSTQKSTLSLFLQHCINTMMSEISKGHATFGLRIMIQCLVKVYPRVTISSINEYKDVLEARKTNPREALSLLWVLGQNLDGNVDQALTAWFQFMMPHLSIKQIANYAVSYLENVINGPVKKELVIQPNEFLSILDIGLSSSSPLDYNPGLQKRIALLFPKFKSLALGKNQKEIFPTLLKRLNKGYAPHYLTEVLNCLCVCLSKDDNCFTVWKQLYEKHLPESSILLKHLVEKRDEAKVPQDQLQELIASFQVTNEELKRKARVRPGLPSCIQSCKALEQKAKKKSFFRFKRLIKLLFFLQLVAVAVDLYKHRGYEGSTTSRLVKEYGVDVAVEKSIAKGKLWADKANSWVSENYPEYYTKTIEVMGPPCKFAGEKATQGWKWFMVKSKPARDYLNEKVPKVLEKIEAELPGYIEIVRVKLVKFWEIVGPHLKHIFGILREFVKENGPILLQKIKELFLMLCNKVYELRPDFFDACGKWVKIITEQVKEKGPQVLAMSKEYAIIALQLTHEAVTGIIEQIKKASEKSSKVEAPGTPQASQTGSAPTPDTSTPQTEKPADTPPQDTPNKSEL